MENVAKEVFSGPVVTELKCLRDFVQTFCEFFAFCEKRPACTNIPCISAFLYHVSYAATAELLPVLKTSENLHCIIGSGEVMKQL